MAIKLKKSTKMQREIILSFGWIVVISSLCIFHILSVYSGDLLYNYGGTVTKVLRVISWIAILLLSLCSILLLYRSIAYLKAFPPREHWTKGKADRIPLEFLLILFPLTLWKWIPGFAVSAGNPYIWKYFYLPYNPESYLAHFVKMCFFVSILYGCALLLLRKWILGIWRETSLLLSFLTYYRNRTALAKRIQNRSRWLCIIQCLLMVLNVACLILGNMIDDDLWLGCIITAFLGILLFVIAFVKNHIYSDVVKLANQIDTIASGGEVTPENSLEERSVLYASSCTLKNMGTEMRENLEKRVKAERMKIDLVTNVSHDLKTPLTSMVGYTDLLKKEALSPEAKDYVEIIAQKQVQLRDMIQDLFELSQATSNSQNLHMEELDMKKLVEQILADMEDAIVKSGHVFKTAYPEESLLFYGDNSKMYRVVQNLLENALKYSMEGTRIYVDIRRTDESIIAVFKNISAVEMTFTADEIVERFSRGDASRSTEGHGLGLAIASSFAQNMGGKLSIELDGDMFKAILEFPVI